MLPLSNALGNTLQKIGVGGLSQNTKKSFDLSVSYISKNPSWHITDIYRFFINDFTLTEILSIYSSIQCRKSFLESSSLIESSEKKVKACCSMHRWFQQIHQIWRNSFILENNWNPIPTQTLITDQANQYISLSLCVSKCLMHYKKVAHRANSVVNNDNNDNSWYIFQNIIINNCDLKDKFRRLYYSLSLA